MSQALLSDRTPQYPLGRHIATVALGGNVTSSWGDPAQTIQLAVNALANISNTVSAVSRFYQTPCFPAGAGPDYINAAAILSTTLSPQAVLAHLHSVEAQFGRERIQRWGMRTLDLDLLAYDAIVHPDPATYRDWRDLAPDQQQIRAPDELVLPHPRLHERAFVLIPLMDIAPGWVHPVLGETLAQMLARLPDADRAGVVPL